jgi:hypothetical protein
MTPEQAAAFVQAQTACALAEIEAMKSENRQRELNDYTHAHDDAAFRAVPDQFGIGHNSVLNIFYHANG